MAVDGLQMKEGRALARALKLHRARDCGGRIMLGQLPDAARFAIVMR